MKAEEGSFKLPGFCLSMFFVRELQKAGRWNTGFLIGETKVKERMAYNSITFY